MSFKPDYRYIVIAATNKRPRRPPIYEHIISPKIMEQVLGERFAELIGGNKWPEFDAGPPNARLYSGHMAGKSLAQLASTLGYSIRITRRPIKLCPDIDKVHIFCRLCARP